MAANVSDYFGMVFALGFEQFYAPDCEHCINMVRTLVELVEVARQQDVLNFVYLAKVDVVKWVLPSIRPLPSRLCVRRLYAYQYLRDCPSVFFVYML